MDHTTDTKRNRPANKGIQNDPDIRDESAVQPGANTISKSKNDEANQQLTKTASDNFKEDKESNEKADKRFDE